MKKAGGSLWKTGEGVVSRSRTRTAKRMLRYLETGEDLKVGVTEVQEQLGTSEKAGVSIRQMSQHAMNENGQKYF